MRTESPPGPSYAAGFVTALVLMALTALSFELIAWLETADPVSELAAVMTQPMYSPLDILSAAVFLVMVVLCAIVVSGILSR